MVSPRHLPTGAVAFSAVIIAAGAALAAPADAQTNSSSAQVTPTANPQSITTVAGNGQAGGGGDGGVAVKAQLDDPTGVAEDLFGALFIADAGNNKVRKVVNPTAINLDVISIEAGTGLKGFSGDGGPAALARLNTPTGVATDTHGDVFVADTGNNRIREVLPTGVIRTIAGDGVCTLLLLSGNGGKATNASLCAPTGVAVDGFGDVFIADSGHHVVRVVNPAGIIGAYAGNGLSGDTGDGGKATNAELTIPVGVGLDAARDVYIADLGASVIREVKPTGIISTFAGKAHAFGYTGDGGSATGAELNGPSGVGVDQSGDVFISDTFNQRIRKVTGGIISTYAGTGTAGFAGDGGLATKAELDFPSGSIASDGTAAYLADTGNNRVRGVFNGPPPVLPETAYAILLPLGAVGLLGSGVLIRRRRRLRAAVMA